MKIKIDPVKNNDDIPRACLDFYYLLKKPVLTNQVFWQYT
jgi:hypothetical protein